jgi:hypothetical protein
MKLEAKAWRWEFDRRQFWGLMRFYGGVMSKDFFWFVSGDFSFVVLRFELRAYTLSHSTSPFL